MLSTDEDFLHLGEIEACLTQHMIRGHWYSLSELYDIVEKNVTLTDADWGRAALGSDSPRWKRNVRNWLQSRKASRDIEWAGDRAEYCMN